MHNAWLALSMYARPAKYLTALCHPVRCLAIRCKWPVLNRRMQPMQQPWQVPSAVAGAQVTDNITKLHPDVEAQESDPVFGPGSGHAARGDGAGPGDDDDSDGGSGGEQGGGGAHGKGRTGGIDGMRRGVDPSPSQRRSSGEHLVMAVCKTISSLYFTVFSKAVARISHLCQAARQANIHPTFAHACRQTCPSPGMHITHSRPVCIKTHQTWCGDAYPQVGVGEWFKA